MMRRLRKMIAQEVSDASSSNAITIGTGTLACTISFRIESGSPIARYLRGHSLAQELRQPPGTQARGIDAGDTHLRLDQKSLPRRAARGSTIDLLREAQRCGPFRSRLTGDLELIIEPCRRAVIDLDAHHGKEDARLARELELRMTLCAQPLGARALEEAQVIGVIDDGTAVGILPVHARWPGEHAHRSPSNSGSVAARSGGLMPKCRYEARVTMRPRAVRTRNPCWMRKGSVTSSSVSRSSPSAAARLSIPTGPPSKRSMIAVSSLRSRVSKPSRSTSSRSSAASATPAPMRPSARTCA